MICTFPRNPQRDYCYDFQPELSHPEWINIGEQVATPNPSCVVEAGKVATCYGYDARDNLASVIDPNGNLTTYFYDDFKRLQKQISPVSGTTTYTYDEAGNLFTSTVTFAIGDSATTTRAYDAANRLLSASSTRSTTTELVSYTYDDATVGKHGKGRVATMTDPTGTTSFAYDRRGLIKTESRVVNGTPFTQSYGYDANGNRTSVTYPSTRVVNYTFDYADRPYSATSGGTTYVTSTTYYPFGPENVLSFGNGTTRTATFDLRYRPSTLALSGASQTVSSFYGTDSLGNITSICGGSPCATPLGALDRNFGYDDLNRLTSATTGPGALWGTPGSFTYDSLGNRKTMNLGARSVTYTYEAISGHDTSRLFSVSEGSQAVRHDNAGNENQFGTSTSTYSPRSYMASADTTSFQYDGRGVRTVERTPSGGSLFYPLTPCRVFDTRGATGPYGAPAIAALATRAFTIWGVCGVPVSGPRAIALNLTAVSPPAYGSLTLFPSDVSLPGTSSISVKPGYTRANNAVMGLSSAGSISLHNSLSAAIDMLMDVSGYFAAAPASARLFFYSPDLSLLSETGITPYSQTPSPLYEYIWFGGRPVAQETVGSSATRWTMTDHIGTPFLQMNSATAVTWRAEYEPFGRIYAYTTGSVADPQPLRLPGQEERSSHTGRSYNVFRWYRPDVGQYAQTDPAHSPFAIKEGTYSYTADNPIVFWDELGLKCGPCCDPGSIAQEKANILKTIKLDVNTYLSSHWYVPQIQCGTFADIVEASIAKAKPRCHDSTSVFSAQRTWIADEPAHTANVLRPCDKDRWEDGVILDAWPRGVLKEFPWNAWKPGLFRTYTPILLDPGGGTRGRCPVGR